MNAISLKVIMLMVKYYMGKNLMVLYLVKTMIFIYVITVYQKKTCKQHSFDYKGKKNAFCGSNIFFLEDYEAYQLILS